MPVCRQESIYDALFLAAGEFLMRQPGIVALHAVTTTNAMRYAFRTVASEDTRRMLLLQNAAFLPMFRESMEGRGEVADNLINSLVAPDEKIADPGNIFANIGNDTQTAAQQVLGYLQNGGEADELIRIARQMIFLKGNDSHDYKFSSAVLEDYYNVSPNWRDYYLGVECFQTSRRQFEGQRAR